MNSTLLFLVWIICAICAAWGLGELIMRMPNLWKLTVKLYLRLICSITRRAGRETVKLGWRWRIRKGKHYTGRNRWIPRRAIYCAGQQMVWSRKSSYDAGWMDNCRDTMRPKEYYRDRNRELVGKA